MYELQALFIALPNASQACSLHIYSSLRLRNKQHVIAQGEL